MFGELELERVEPGEIGPAFLPEQLVTRAHRRVVAADMMGVAGLEREDEPVEEAAAPFRAFGEQPVHRRGQPEQRDPFSQRGCGGRRAIDADLPAIG